MIARAELQDSVRKAFQGGSLPPDAAASWGQIAALGLLMVAVPEDKGGLGLGGEAVAAVHFELGRALVPGPAIAHMLVIEALAAGDAQDLLDAAMAGQVMTVAHFAVDADNASHVLFGGDGGIRLADSFEASATPVWDKTRRLFAVTETGGESAIAEGQAATALTDHLKKRFCLMLAADALGGANAALEMTVEYLKTRRQFDRPLAMFQALKHRAADMKAALTAAEALLWQRAGDDAATLAQMGALKAHACEIYRAITEEAIQLHGGIGLTAEHPCHLYLKRALLNCAVGGDADYWEEIAGREALTTR